MAAAIPAQLAWLIVPYVLLRGLKKWNWGVWPVWPVALIAAVYALLLLLPVLTRVHRHRLRVAAGIAIAPHPKGQYRWPTARAVDAALRSQAAWRQACYHLLVAPALAGADLFSYTVLEPAKGAATVARLDTGDPWIVERAHGRGMSAHRNHSKAP